RRERDLTDGVVVGSVRREADSLPRADRAAARDEQRRARAVAPALVEKAVQDVDLRGRLVESPRSADRNGAGRSRHPGNGRLSGREELARNDSLQILIEPLEETAPSSVRLEPQAVEFVTEGQIGRAHV